MSQEIPKEPAKQPVNGGSWITYVVVVFVLIFVLGLVLAPVVKIGPPNLLSTKAAVMEKQLEMACRAYLIEYGKLPSTSENYQLVKTLTSVTSDNPRGVTFINIKPTDLTLNGDLLDPWGTPYRITFDANTNIIVNSAGPDKIFGTPDDIRN